jgi:hypothetical protein
MKQSRKIGRMSMKKKIDIIEGIVTRNIIYILSLEILLYIFKIKLV